MNSTKKIALSVLTIITFSNVTTYGGRGWGGGGSFAAGALTGAAVTGIAVSASRPHYREDTYTSKSKCRKAIRELEKENDELYSENKELIQENKDLLKENRRLRNKRSMIN